MRECRAQWLEGSAGVAESVNEDAVNRIFGGDRQLQDEG